MEEEVEATQESLLVEDKNKNAADTSDRARKERKKKARKERRKRRKNRSCTTPYIDYQKIAVNALFEIVLLAVKNDDIPDDAREEREKMVSHFLDGKLLPKEYVNQKLLEARGVYDQEN